MSLYPTITISPAIAATTPTMVPSGTLILLQMDIISVQMTQIKLAHLPGGEDFSLRCWLSLYPNGPSLIDTFPGFFPLVRSAIRPLVIYIEGQTPPADSMLALVPHGSYYLNVLNLTNTPNAFAFEQLTLA